MTLFNPLRPRSVRAQLMLWNIGALAVIMGALGFLLHYTLRTNLMISIDKDLAARVAPFSGMGVWRRGIRRSGSNTQTNRASGLPQKS